MRYTEDGNGSERRNTTRRVVAIFDKSNCLIKTLLPEEGENSPIKERALAGLLQRAPIR